MFDLQKFNTLLGTNFASIDEITDHQLLAALVTLTAASLGVSIFVCNPTSIPADGATPAGFCECGTSLEHHAGMYCSFRPAAE